MEDDDGHFCGWCGGDWLPDGQPCPAISLGHEPAGDEAGELREYYVTFIAG